MQRPTRVRLIVLLFACSLSLLTYLDRVCIMRVGEDMQRDLGFTDIGMGFVFSAFLLGYTLFEVPGGWMGDRWGSRRVLTLIVLVWSLFTAMTGMVWPFEIATGIPELVIDAFVLMLVVRFLFGCGEAGAYPNLARVTASWFPFRERAVTQGAIWMSARLGGALAPFAFGRMAGAVGGWRPAFWMLGVVGAAWCLLFFWWFRDRPKEKLSCNDAERELIEGGPHAWAAAHGHGHLPVPWALVFTSPTVWCLCVASATVSFSWYFYPTWQPKFLKETYNISYADSEILTGLPFLCGAFGCILGGGLSDWIIQRTGSRRWGRSLIGAVAFAGAGLCVWATGHVWEPWQAVALLCLAFFINDLGIPPIWAASADVGGRYAGTLAGLMNTAGGIGAIFAPVMTPVLRQYFTWPGIFAILAMSWFVGAIAWLGVNAGKPLERA